MASKKLTFLFSFIIVVACLFSVAAEKADAYLYKDQSKADAYKTLDYDSGNPSTAPEWNLAALPIQSNFVSPAAHTIQTINFPNLFYQWSWKGCSGDGCVVGGSGYETALSSGYAQVAYMGYIHRTNVTTGATSWISDTDTPTLNVGDNLVIDPGPLTNDQIFWFGSGNAQDSPFGIWAPNAQDPYPVFNTRYFYFNSTCGFYCWYNYYGLSIAPPPVTLSTAGSTAGVTCTQPDPTKSAISCTITSPGSLKVAFNYANTSGHFYYGYKYTTRSDSGGDYILLNSANTSDIYTMNVPAASIVENFNIASVNQPPSPPVITGPTPTYRNQDYPFSFRSTDPENENIYYQIDWHNLSTASSANIDATIPADNTYLPSGTSGTANNPAALWPTIGTKYFKVRAVDASGNFSTWTTYPVTIANRPPTAPDINGPTDAKPGTSQAYNFTSTDADGDTINYTVSDWGDGTTSASRVFVNSGDSYTYSHTWAADGVYTITAHTVDNQTPRGVSPDAQYTVNIATNCPTCTGGGTPLTAPLCQADPDSAQVTTGTLVTFSPETPVIGGTPPYKFDWLKQGNKDLSTTTIPAYPATSTCTVSTVGDSCGATYIVTDSVGATQGNTCFPTVKRTTSTPSGGISVTVTAARQQAGNYASSVSVNKGSSAFVQGTVSGGVGTVYCTLPDTSGWRHETGFTAPDSTGFPPTQTQAFVDPGATYTYSMQCTDSAGNADTGEAIIYVNRNPIFQEF